MRVLHKFPIVHTNQIMINKGQGINMHAMIILVMMQNMR